MNGRHARAVRREAALETRIAVRAYAPRDRKFRRHLLRRAAGRAWKDAFHRMRWKLSLLLTGDPYARPLGPGP